ncbi:hypothetical protein PCANC_03359 [Puccinia coronata f. sp. avenae]|uniref:Uncharacterized protein n=1 Tax=Puccinia coronata f. sp. avenae TaxID=200324 RepID=A0A2N5T8W5_9BASI|nr:hypothetical protein PCANC_03359 [Puccinia coronata f. sp. avenae]
MTGDDIDSHIEKMGNYAEKLNALVSTKNPLTADNIHSTAMFFLLPDDWLHCVSSMMNEEQVSSTWCSGHDMAKCNNLAKVIKDHKAQRHQEFLVRQSNDSSKSKPTTSKSLSKKATEPARAGLAAVVELDDFSGKDNDNLSGSKYLSYEVSRAAVTPLAGRISSIKNSDFNLDSRCSISMTLFISSINEAKKELIPIKLADNTVVNSTHSVCAMKVLQSASMSNPVKFSIVEGNSLHPSTIQHLANHLCLNAPDLLCLH